jgi:UDP-N-acetylglucosamine 1-carboxyvinyltransferase
VAEVHLTHDGSPLRGELRLDGAKHAFAHSLACAALADEGHLTEVPDHVDARALREALALVFDDVEYRAETAELWFRKPRARDRVLVDADLVGRSRSLFCLLPALLIRAREVVLAGAPQGCQIGVRPTGWYVDTLARFGVVTDTVGDVTVLSWTDRRPADVTFDYPTMTGTVVAVAAAAAVAGTSTIRRASVEPSCGQQLACLRALGAGVGGELPDITVTGRDRYPVVKWRVAADRIHAVTFLTAGLLTRGEVTVTSGGPIDIPRFVEFLTGAGVRVQDRGNAITAGFPERGHLRPVRIDAGSEPLFSSDWVTFAALLLATRSAGESVLSDDVFPGRFQFVESLRPFGLTNVRTSDGSVRGRSAVFAHIDGDPRLRVAPGRYGPCPDIRGSAALLLAGLVADGPMQLVDDFHLRRGYGDLPGGLRTLGVRAVGTEKGRDGS